MRRLAGVVVMVVALSACQSSSSSSSPTQSARKVFDDFATNTPSSLQSAIAAAEPGSAAAKYFSAWLFYLRAYVGVGGGGAPIPLIPVKDGVAFCTRLQGKSVCMEFQHPSFAADARLSGFTVNGVDAARLVRLVADVPAAQFAIAPGISARIVALRRDPLDALNVVLKVENDTDTPRSLPNGTAFLYGRDGSNVPVPATGYATPATVAARSSALLSLTFHDANFGGTLMFPNAAGANKGLRVPGPPVALPNKAAERV